MKYSCSGQKLNIISFIWLPQLALTVAHYLLSYNLFKFMESYLSNGITNVSLRILNCFWFVGITHSLNGALQKILDPPSNFFLTIAYFVNGNTQLMSDLTDIQFYTSAKRILLCTRFNNAGKYCDITYLGNVAEYVGKLRTDFER